MENNCPVPEPNYKSIFYILWSFHLLNGWIQGFQDIFKNIRKLHIFGAKVKGTVRISRVFKQPKYRLHFFQFLQIVFTWRIRGGFQTFDTGLITVLDSDIFIADFQFYITGIIFALRLWGDGTGNAVENVTFTYQVDHKRSRSGSVVDDTCNKWMIFFGYKVKDAHKHIPKRGFTWCIGSHYDIHFFVAKIRVIFQMLILNIRVNDFFGIG